MEMVLVLVAVIALSFFLAVIAIVAIVFGQQKVVDQAVQALSEALKAIFKKG
jgi:hypothetical protein